MSIRGLMSPFILPLKQGSTILERNITKVKRAIRRSMKRLIDTIFSEWIDFFYDTTALAGFRQMVSSAYLICEVCFSMRKYANFGGTILRKRVLGVTNRMLSDTAADWFRPP